MNERPISRRAHREHVPSYPLGQYCLIKEFGSHTMAPYPFGHGSGLPAASDGHIPFAYICERPFVAIGIIANDVPTTLISPVPM
jgi:hypothetical protein